ncbi:uncharacterized protein O3C94_011080 [Discoglossus pictus]
MMPFSDTCSSVTSSLSEPPQADEYLPLIQDLEQRLRTRTDNLEHLRLSVAEVLSNSSTGFRYIQQSSLDLKKSLAEHRNALCDLNERMDSLQMGTVLFLQMNTKPKLWGNKRGAKKYQHAPRPQFCDDTQSELGWNPLRPRRNSDTASELSCAW